RNEQLFFSGAGTLNINRGKGALVHQLAVENDFTVARSFEFFEDDIVHAGTSVDERGGNDGQRAAFFDVPRGTEETLRTLQSVGVHAAGKNFTAGRDNRVVGAGQTGNRVEQNHNIALVLN